mgnify:CR=1 FL=1|jgi:hypothetical protein
MEKKTADVVTYISLAVIVISLAFIGTNLTGRATTDTGIVNITIESSSSINFTTDLIDFGSGRTYPNSTYGVMQTNGSGAREGGNWTLVSNGFNITNNGNGNLTLNISSNVTAETFIGGTAGGGPIFGYMIDNSTATSGSACLNATYPEDQLTWGNFSTTTQEICTVFGFLSGDDSVAVDVYLKIPQDATPGYRAAQITATGTS